MFSNVAYGLTDYKTGPLTLFMRHNRPNLEEIEEVLPSCFCVMTSSPLWRLRSWHWEKVRPTNWTNMYSVYLNNKVAYFVLMQVLMIQLNLHETDLLFQYLSHHLTWHCSSISEDLQEICSICSQNCFCYCFCSKIVQKQ